MTDTAPLFVLLLLLPRLSQSALDGHGGTVVGSVRTVPDRQPVGDARLGVLGTPLSTMSDADGRFRGVSNLWITDGSVLPLSAGVNPSLTIAANALRSANLLVGQRRAHASGARA